MIILRQHIYSSRPGGYNARGFLTNPVLADDSTLDFTIESYEQNKKYWKKNKKSIDSLIGTIKTGINASIAKKEKRRREKVRDSIDTVKEWKEKTFARKDYEGLSLVKKYELRKRRNNLAKETRRARKAVFESNDEEVQRLIKEGCEKIDKDLDASVQRIQNSAIDQKTKNEYIFNRSVQAEVDREHVKNYYTHKKPRLINIYWDEQIKRDRLKHNLNPVKNPIEKHKDKLVKGGLGVAGVGTIAGGIGLVRHNNYVNNNLREI